jgi:hypothetical protein
VQATRDALPTVTTIARTGAAPDVVVSVGAVNEALCDLELTELAVNELPLAMTTSAGRSFATPDVITRINAPQLAVGRDIVGANLLENTADTLPISIARALAAEDAVVAVDTVDRLAGESDALEVAVDVLPVGMEAR